MTNLGSNGTEEPAGQAAPVKKGLGLSPVQVIAGAGAAAVASVIGGHLGLAGTVVGAFLSVVSGIALPLFRTSLEKSHEQLRRVVPGRATGAARTTRPQSDSDTAGKAGRGAKLLMTIGGMAAIFIIGVGSILGIQSVTGVSLSPGTRVLQSGVSQVVTTVKDGNGSSPTDPNPGTPTEDPTEQPTEAPAPTSDPAPSAESTAPAGADTPAPPETPDPAAGLSDGSSGAGAASSQVQPGPGTSAGDVPAK